MHDPLLPKWENDTLSQVGRVGDPKVIGYTLRTNRYLYTEWVKLYFHLADWDTPLDTELYDYKLDPDEDRNRASILILRRNLLINCIMGV